MANELTLDLQRTALLIMDYENDLLAQYGDKTPALLDRASALLDGAREAGLAVIYVVVRFRDGYPEIGARNRMMSAMKKSNRVREGTPGAEIHTQVAPQAGEPLVIKRRVGAFGATDLQTILNAHDLTTLILAGVSTGGVVLSTVRWAADADYELIVVADCCLDPDEEVHDVLMRKVFPRQASVVSSAQVLAALKASR